MGTLRMIRGDTFSFDADFNAELADETLIAFTVRRGAFQKGSPLVRKDNKARGGVVVDVKKVTVVLKPEDTLALPNESRIYGYEIIQQNSDGSFFTLDAGEFQVRSNLSH